MELKWKQTKNHTDAYIPLGNNQEVRLCIFHLAHAQLIMAWAHHWMMFTDSSFKEEKTAKSFCEEILAPRLLEYIKDKDPRAKNFVEGFKY